MSSDLQAVVAALQFGDYISLVVPTAVIYDYIITFPQEIDYIWNRSWSFVSVMFILVRYLGLTVAVLDGFFESTFIPGPILVRTVLFFLDVWGFIVFLAASDIVMILRVYAMYNKSRIILGVLLVCYASEIILFTISEAYYNTPNTYLTMTTPHVLNMSFCYPTYSTTSRLGVYKFIPRLVLAALLFILAVARICMDYFQTYKLTKRWQVNQYINLLVREGILYFLAHLLYIIDFGQTTPGIIMSVLSTVVMFILSPRFIMSVRELHDLIHTGVDTGFGIGKCPPTGVSSVRFANSNSGLTFDTTEDSEEVEMQVVGSNTGSQP